MKSPGDVRTSRPTPRFSVSRLLTPEFHAFTSEGQPLRGGGVRQMHKSKFLSLHFTLALIYVWGNHEGLRTVTSEKALRAFFAAIAS